MSNRAVITTQLAPRAIGPYSQGIKVGNTVWISGQIALDPKNMELVPGGITMEARRIFQNLDAIAKASGGNLDDAVKINISLTDMSDFNSVNTVMSEALSEPYPARACVEVSALPRGARVEIEAVLAI